VDITIHRVNPYRYYSTARRDDGVTVRIPGYDRPEWLPHDLAHITVERELGLRGGFWARVAAGAMFPNMTVLSGRRPPHAEERSRALIRANGDELTRAEVLAGAFLQLAQEGLDVSEPVALARIARAWSSAGREPFTLDHATIVRVCAALRAAAQLWREVPVGGSLTLPWKLRADPVALHRHREGAGRARRATHSRPAGA
jgi:hypothetical protein